MARGRLAEIDGLRGLAALSVMLGHWAEFIAKQNAPQHWVRAIDFAFLDYFSFGRLGVVAFFCVSGFVVPFSFRGARPLLSFPISRMFRLYPAYWASILAVVIVFPLTGGETFGLTRTLVNFTMIQRITPYGSVLAVYWTLFIELLFYAVCFAMFAAGLLRGFRANFAAMMFFLLVAVAGGAYRFIHPTSDLPIGVPTYLAAMHFGTIARLRVLDDETVSRRGVGLALATLMAGVLTANTLAYLYAHNELVGVVAANLGYIAGVALFLAAISLGWFAGPRLAFLGLVSYSAYLFHMLTIQFLWALWPAAWSWELTVLMLTPIYLAVTIAIAALVHRFVEKPAISIGRSLDTRLQASLDGRSRVRAT